MFSNLKKALVAHCETSLSQAALEHARISAVAQACSSCTEQINNLNIYCECVCVCVCVCARAHWSVAACRNPALWCLCVMQVAGLQRVTLNDAYIIHMFKATGHDMGIMKY